MFSNYLSPVSVAFSDSTRTLQTSHLQSAICSQLCQIHPRAMQSPGVKKSRCVLILTNYVAIRDAVLNSPRLMAQTNLQLFELNQRTISQW